MPDSTPERWKRIEELYQAALRCLPEQREALLTDAQPDIRREVESLLGRHAGDDPAGVTLTQAGTGAKFGHYKIESKIGEGGMGEVYRAVDTRLGRKVAIKVSAQQYNERFEREARAISALNHPHICTLYDVGPNYLVMELVEGETLAARLKKGKLSVADTLRYGTQTAEALAEAHAKTITHRDLKPGNIMIAKNGIKVLDFGLARSAEDETLTAAMVVMGTPAYMAPEQAEGRPCDHRTDIYALGLILYEMATGKRPPRDRPAPMEDLPDRLAHVMERCLVEDPAERWQSALDVRHELAWAAQTRQTPIAPAQRGAWVASTVAALAVITAVAVVLWRTEPQNVATEQTSFQIPPPAGGAFASPPIPIGDVMEISPDGLQVAFVATVEGQTRVWIRERKQVAARPLAGTEGASGPFWSPDSRSVAFFAGGKLKRIEAAGGAPRNICDVSAAAVAGTWGQGGTILFSDSIPEMQGMGLFQVSGDGGAAKVAARPDVSRGEGELIWSHFLPDGKRYLYTSFHAGRMHVHIGSLAGAQPRVLMEEDSRIAYANPGYLLFVREASLLAQKFDMEGMRLEGSPLPVVEQMEYVQATGLAPFSVSANGVLAYQELGQSSRLLWLDRNGRELSALTTGDGAYEAARVSPDGRKVAVSKRDPRIGSRDLYVIETSNGTSTRVTSTADDESAPVWSPDSRRIVFSWNNKAPPFLHELELDSAGPPKAVTPRNPKPSAERGTEWLKDGSVLFDDSGPETDLDLWLVPPDGDRKPRQILATKFADTSGTVSPNGRWIAYVSTDSGQAEVYVRSFPQIGGPRRISKNGGTNPRWAREGRELYFLERDRVMAAAVQGDSDFSSGNPAPLFQRAEGIVDFDVAADGRFLVNIGKAGFLTGPINVVVNWTEALKR